MTSEPLTSPCMSQMETEDTSLGESPRLQAVRLDRAELVLKQQTWWALVLASMPAHWYLWDLG